MLISYAESPAQIDTSYFPRYLEQVIEDNSDENIKSQFYDQIEFLLENPIEINNASEEELLKIPFLDRADAAAIIKYRNEQGRIDSADQMRKIEGIEAETINRIIPFILINKNKEAEKSEGLLPRSLPVRLSLRSRLIRDLKQNLGFQSGKYVGSDLKLYNRITISSNDKVRIGLITEKDPGEKSPADFYSCHLLLRDLGPVKTLLVGDYTFEFGQGLALWGTSSLYKGNETTGLLPRNAHSIVPYLSTNENVVLRGMAIQFSYLHFNVYSFFSYKYLDGSVDTAGNTIGSLDQDGYHRDSSEIARKHTIGEKLMGLAFDYGYKSIFNAGLIYFSTSYSSRFNKRTSFDPSGNKFDFI